MKTLTANEMIQYFNEYQTKKHQGLRCGIDSLDNIIRMDKKNFAVLTAKPNQGKSTFINFYCYRMAKNNNWRTLYFNFETSNGRFINDLVNLYGNIEDVIRYCNIVDVNNITNLNDLYNTIKEVNEIKNIDMVVIDPFMRLNGWLQDINTYTIGKVLTDLQQLAINEDVLMLVIAHPTKVKEGVDINPNDIMGSTYFYTVSDFIFSLEITDRENMITQIKTLKIRNNFDMGLCCASCYLQFDPITKQYEETDINDIDVPFDEETAKNVMKEILNRNNANRAVSEPFNNDTDKLQANGVKTAQNEKETQIQTSKVVINPNEIMVGVFKNCNCKVPQKFVSLKESTLIGLEQKEIINNIRTITEQKKDGWEIKKRELKQSLKCYLPSIKSRNRRVEEDTQYNNLICFDIDEKDNTKPLEEIKDIICNDKYTLYCGLSASGKGLFGYFVGNGDINDYKSQFEAMKTYLRDKGIIIDDSASDITRLRFSSYDENDYWNLEPLQFESCANTHNHQNNNLEVPKERNKLFEDEKKWFNHAIKEIENEHLILTKNHEETNAIGLEIAYYFGLDGLDYYLTIRKQRASNYIETNSINKYYNICSWLDSNNYMRGGRMQTIRHFYYRAIENQRNEALEKYVCGTFAKQ